MIPNTFLELMNSGGLVVGLNRHVKRLDQGIKLLTDVGFKNLQRHFGVDGFKEPVYDILRSNNWKLMNAPIKNELGGIGFTLTTLFLWKKIIDENLPYLLIFEDDVLPHPQIGVLGEEFWRETPRDWDFLFLGSDMDCKVQDKVVSIPCFCTHAYLVSNKGAKRAFELIDKDHDGIDKADCQLIVWMNNNLIKWYCWNGNSVPKPYKTSKDSSISNEDNHIIWEEKGDGIFYQDYKLGTTIFREEVYYERII